ncbi:ectoine/hydroxyectoine ABC transporter substrate-binding protein EhuB [Cupriavidus consociatus]|uniref:ectoine/hydroxyectoine ABC transporter substrate-binding protein EhuB n=1 Tax=Cupriavidus consociatus TaxID=2821357 RepID=UPI001AE9AF97|nr:MULTISPECIES: ectoine/hydroxyectoine ABC transporter substrate-binding protein EhuB [unclassified Cupriavidus]MBP0625302.1 ectoine/hydroxyectoine ABC transporter substrate-binding protein EhuB [Cupriavidus sp. LEh25]MDK2662038.1 ectoine/hydroxyectoine ABC transporter substrate-binding protein EhuB [Cupriavidus sp. LEh21]
MVSLSKTLMHTAICGLTVLASQVAHGESIKDRVLKEGRLTIGIHNQAPWGFKTETGEVSGFHPDMIRAVLGPLGVKKIDFVIVEWSAIVPSLLAKRVDVVASGLAISPVRCQQVAFSEPDVAVVDALLVKKGNPLKIHSYADIVANPNVRVAGGRNSASVENAQKAGVPKSQFQLFPGVEAGVSALLGDRADAASYSSATIITVLNDPKIKGLERAAPFAGLKEAGHEVASYAAIAFRPEDAALRDLYSDSLRKRKADGTVAKIMAKYGFTSAETVPESVTAQNLCRDAYR